MHYRKREETQRKNAKKAGSTGNKEYREGNRQ